MFEVGKFIRGKLSLDGKRVYGITHEQCLCEILSILEGGWAKVKVIAHVEEELVATYEVELDNFEECTLEEFFNVYPNAYLLEKGVSEKMEIKLFMDKEKIGSHVLSSEEREKIKEEIIDLLTKYHYEPSDYGVNRIIDKWIENKGWMINLFKNDPNYNGKFQICYDMDYEREFNKKGIKLFGTWLADKVNYNLKETIVRGHSYVECCRIHNKLEAIISNMYSIKCNGYYVSANGKTLEELRKERDYWKEKIDYYKNSEDIHIYLGTPYNKKEFYLSDSIKALFNEISEYGSHIANEHMSERFNSLFPELKAVSGQKISKIVNKIGTLLNIPKDRAWEQNYAKFTDAINPLVIKKHTILSCHPVDYLTMSFGNSWGSCHTIDKRNERNADYSYNGCYSSGTLSYMLDESSFVFYTLSNSYNGNEYELQDKIERNMFHIGEDKLVQGRVYPQSTDGDTGVYKQFREITQKIIADCLGAPNLWKNEKGIEECEDVIYSQGTHYEDYFNFNSCNVSYLKNNGTYNIDKFTVGHDPICPNCGYTHDYQESIECEDCYDDSTCHECYCCDGEYDEEDMYYIDGHWYCSDCSTYCSYHEQREVGDFTYVNGYGYVCDDGLYDGDDFYECEECGEWYYNYNNEGIYIDDAFYCSESCAEESHVRIDGVWYHEDDVYTCPECGQVVPEDKWDDDLEMCYDCTERIERREAV